MCVPVGAKRTLEQSAITDDDGGFVIHCSQTYTRDTSQVEAGSPGVRLTLLSGLRYSSHNCIS